jgi:hypothetical protein
MRFTLCAVRPAKEVFNDQVKESNQERDGDPGAEGDRVGCLTHSDLMNLSN